MSSPSMCTSNWIKGPVRVGTWVVLGGVGAFASSALIVGKTKLGTGCRVFTFFDVVVSFLVGAVCVYFPAC